MKEIAGAISDPITLGSAGNQDINPEAALDNKDGHGFFEALGNSVISGLTLTNLRDFRGIYIADPK